MDEELEDKYSRFYRYFDIDLQAEIAAGGSEGGLTNYYTKAETNTITDALAGRITILEESESGGADLSNYYTKGQVDSAIATRQLADSDLTAIAGLAPTNNDVLQRVAGSWTNVAPATLKTSLSLNKTDVGLGNVNNTTDLGKPISTATQSALDSLDARVDILEGTSGPDLTNYYTKSQTDTLVSGKQNVDSDLSAIAALAPTDNDILQRKTGAWVNRTPAQFKSDLGLSATDVGLGNVNNTSDAGKPISTATQTALDSKQASNANLTTISGLSPTNGDLLQRVSGNWTNRTIAQIKSDFNLAKTDVGLGNVDNTSDSAKPISSATQTALDGKQPLDSDLTTIAGLTVVNDSVLQGKAGAWAVRTPAQLKTDLSLTKSDVGLSNVDNTADTAKPISSATQTALDGKQPLDSDLTTIAGLTVVNDSVLQGKAGAWSVRTPAQLKTDLTLVKADVGLGNVDNTSDATKNAAAVVLTNKDLTSGTNTFPTFNQSTSGNAATATKLATARTINGVSFDGTGNITVADSTKVPTTRTVAGKALSADITLAKGDVGLGNVDNTSDTNKPVSTATQTALDLKAPLADTPRYLIFNTTWPARPADSRMTFFIGGDAVANAPADAISGDVWIPNT